jgi:hypothetical protein
MALALAAELNGYPGPMHVLEHADALGLSGAQRAVAEDLRTRMLGEARALGARIIALEEERSWTGCLGVGRPIRGALRL